MTMSASFKQHQLPERTIHAAILSSEDIFAIGDIHGHSPAITLPLSAETISLKPCDEIDRFSRICLDIGSAQLSQIAWARFYRCGEETKMQIAAVSELVTVDPSDLFF